MILSICICTLYKRAGMLASLLRELETQIHNLQAQDLVEILTEADDGKMSTGQKRNLLNMKATGKYVSHVDDDDIVYPYYIQEILKAVETDPDAVAMNGLMTTDLRVEQRWFISKDNPYQACRTRKGHTIYLRYHNHLSPIRRLIALQFPFPDKYMHEDSDYADALHKAKAVKTEVAIGTTAREYLQTLIAVKPMYIYRYNSMK